MVRYFYYFLLSVAHATWTAVREMDSAMIRFVTWETPVLPNIVPIIEPDLPASPTPQRKDLQQLEWIISMAWTCIDGIALHLETLYEDIRWTHALVLVILIPPAYYMVRRLLSFTARVIRLTSMKIRGVQLVCSYGEALRAGSVFRAGKMPRGQVEIRIPGIFTTSHNGYGLRLGDVLVCNEHELSGYPEVEVTSVDDKGQRRTVALDTTGRMPSPVLNDVTYLMLDPKAWARLAVPKAKAVPMTDTGRFVTCHGQEGSSSGTLAKTNVLGQVVYTGSTLPGMSGAAYHVEGQIFGMHNGVMGGLNVGFGMEPIVKDIKMLFGGPNFSGAQQESPSLEERLMTQQERKRNKGKKTVWTNETLEEAYARIVGGPKLNTTEEEDEIDAIWGIAASKKESLNEPLSENQQRLAQMAALVKRQSDDEPTHTVPLVVMTPKQDAPTQAEFSMLMDVVEKLQVRIAVLESKVILKAPLGTPQQKTFAEVVQSQPEEESDGEEEKKEVPKFACDQCSTKCRTEKRLEAHYQSAHAEPEKFNCSCGVVCRTKLRLENHQRECKAHHPEATHLYDNSVKSVKMDKTNFLAERRGSSSPTTTSKSSKNNSKSLAKKDRSPSQAELLSAILQSQQNMQKSLSDLAKAMAGQSSVGRRN